MKKILLLLFFAAPLCAFAYTSPGKPTGFVNDFAGVLTVEQRASLEQALQSNQQATGNEITVVTVPSLGGDTVENYAEKLFKEWGIGQKGKDNGALLLVAIGDRKMRIEVGYGLEPTLTDAISSRIIRNTITPEFKAGKYYEGIAGGVEQMVAATKGEALTPEPKSFPWPDNIEAYFIFFWILSGLFQWFLSVLARSRSWWMGGVAGGAIGILVMIFATLTLGLIITAIFVPLGLLFDYFISREYAKSSEAGRTPHWWAGGPWIGGGFGGGGSGGGFGGFDGGSSGGGGSSGNW